MLEYIRKKSSELLDFQVEEGEGPADPGEANKDAEGGEGSPQDGAEDASMVEPLDMDMFLELAQEIEAEKGISSPFVRSPQRPTLTPLIRLGPERPTPSFDWNARQKDAVQISWETQEQESERQRSASQHSSDADYYELPGETQLQGAEGAMDVEPEASQHEDESRRDSDEELPTMTQLQGGSLAPFDPSSPAGDAEDHEVDLPPESLLKGESDAFAEGEAVSGSSETGDIDNDDFPTETQLHGYAGAFTEPLDAQATILEEDEEEDDMPSETQLNGHSNALAPIQPLEPLEEGEEEERSALPETDDFPEPDQFEGDDAAFATQAAGNGQADQSQSDVEGRDRGDLPESDVAEEQSSDGTQSGLPDMDELAGDYAALNVSEPEEAVEAVDEEDELPESDPAMGSSQGVSEPDPAGDDGRAPAPSDIEREGGEAEAPVGVAGDPADDVDGDELPSADQLQGQDGFLSDDNELAVAHHLAAEALAQASREEQPPSASAPTEHVAQRNSQLDAQGTPAVQEETQSVDVSTADALPQNELAEPNTTPAVHGLPEVIESAVAVDILHAEAAIAALSDAAEPPLTEPKISAAETRQALNPSAAGPGPRHSLPARFLHPRRPDLTEFATPDPEDGPVEDRPSTSNAAARHLHGPRRLHRLRTDSPTQRSHRYSPPMLLPFVPHHAETSPAIPKTPSQAQTQEPGSSLLGSGVIRTTSTLRMIDSQTPLGGVRRQIVTHVRSEGAASICPRRARSNTGRLGYVAPRNDPYLHDEDGGPLEPDPEYVTPDVYPTPPQDRAERRTRVPMHRKARRWTEGEALLLYRTIQKAWWSERTAQQVAWYLHGEWGQMSQRLKAFSVQNMKDKMREIVKTRVRNDRAVVGRARHWLPAGHPDREAYEEEMAAWADAENERLQQEQEEAEEEEERKALEAAQADEEEMEDEVAAADLGGSAEELPDEEMDWEAHPELLVDVEGQEHASELSEHEDGRGGPAVREAAHVTREPSAQRTTRAARTSIGARWRTDNDDEIDELESDQGEPEPADDFADNISVVSAAVSA